MTCLNRSRMIVALLLLGVVAVGFGQGLNVENASGVITSYSTTTVASTWTSMSYYYYERTSTSVAFTISTVTALVQEGTGGPYLKITATAKGSSDGIFFVDLWIEAEVTNLMEVPVNKGKIVYLIYNLDRTVTEEATATFWEIKPMETIRVRHSSAVTKRFPVEYTYYRFMRAEVECAGITTQVPLATYTSLQRFTETHLRTYTSTYEKVSTFSIEEPSPFLNAQTMLALVAVAAVAVVAIVFMKMRKPSAQPSLQGQPSKQVCSSCGAVVEVGSEFCHNCGKKIE